MGLPTLMDIAIATGNDAAIGLIDETIKEHPELTAIMARPMKGRTYKTRVRTALGRVTGSFRDANEGTTPIKHRYENRTVETYILNPQFAVDKAVADSYPDGSAEYIATEREGIMEGELQGLATQFFYGTTSGNAKGFLGLIDSVTDAMTLDAGGTTASTGSTVWAVRSGLKDVLWRWGDGGSLELTQPVIIPNYIDPNDSTKSYPAYFSYMQAYPGLQVGSIQSIGRIKDLTEDNGKTLTDALIAQLVALFPVGKPPTALFMTRRSRLQLQISRTVVLQGGGAGNPSPVQGTVGPLPTESQGIPIHVTDALLNTETLS